MRKIIFALLSYFITSYCTAQDAVIYDTDDFIRPSWLDVSNYSDSTLKHIYFFSAYGGIGPSIHYLPQDSINPENILTSFWFASCFYFNRFQLNLKTLFWFTDQHNSGDISYRMTKTLKPQLQMAYYPKMFGNSYLSDQLRLQFTWNPSVAFSSIPGRPATLRNNFKIEYGGFFTNQTKSSRVPQTAFLPYLNYQSDSADFNYGFNFYSGFLSSSGTTMRNTLYAQVSYTRQNISGGDTPDYLILGFVDELYPDAQSNTAVYIMLSYKKRYASTTPEKENELHFGLFINVPLFNHGFYVHENASVE